MKGIILVGLLLVLLLGAALGGYFYLAHGCAALAAEVSGVNQALQRQDWGRAGDLLDRATARWEGVHGYWSVLVDHEIMRDIEIGFVDLAVAVEKQDLFEACKEAEQLVFYVEHVAESERPEVENLL